MNKTQNQTLVATHPPYSFNCTEKIFIKTHCVFYATQLTPPSRGICLVVKNSYKCLTISPFKMLFFRCFSEAKLEV